MKNDGKSIRKIKLSIFTVLMILTFLSAGASASVKVFKTPLDATDPPGTERLSCPCGKNCIDYTVVAASSTDPRVVKFVDRSNNKESFMRWDFGDGTSLQGTKITTSLKNPIHKFAKTGYYISCFSIKCAKCGKNMWVHKTIIIK